MAAEQKIREMQSVALPVERLFAHSVLIEASLNILMRHNLLSEFSAEVSRLESIGKGARVETADRLEPPHDEPRDAVGSSLSNGER